MKNPFKHLFKKKEEPKALKKFLSGPIFSNGKPMPDIIVDADVAFREPPSKKVAEIRKLFEPVKFDELEFEEEIEDFALDLISKESKRKIIQIIKEDMIQRGVELTKTREKMYKDAPTYDITGLLKSTKFVETGDFPPNTDKKNE
jgi:hypothetical protein